MYEILPCVLADSGPRPPKPIDARSSRTPRRQAPSRVGERRFPRAIDAARGRAAGRAVFEHSSASGRNGPCRRARAPRLAAALECNWDLRAASPPVRTTRRSTSRPFGGLTSEPAAHRRLSRPGRRTRSHLRGPRGAVAVEKSARRYASNRNGAPRENAAAYAALARRPSGARSGDDCTIWRRPAGDPENPHRPDGSGTSAEFAASRPRRRRSRWRSIRAPAAPSPKSRRRCGRSSRQTVGQPQREKKSAQRRWRRPWAERW